MQRVYGFSLISIRENQFLFLKKLKEKWSCLNKSAIHRNIKKKIIDVDTTQHTKQFRVNRYDTDSNKHVNNIRYLQWVIESIPEEITDNYFLHEIDGRFIAEAQYGDTVLSLTKKLEANNSFAHTIKIEGSNTVCATANTIWQPY